MGIGKKLNLLFLSILLLMFISSIVMIINLKNIDQKVDEVINQRVKEIILIDDFELNIAMRGLYARAYFIDATPSNEENLTKYAYEEFDRKFAEISELTNDDSALIGYVKQLEENEKQYEIHIGNFVNAVKQGDLQRAQSLIINELTEANVIALNVTNEMLQVELKDLDLISNQAVSKIDFSQIIAIILLIIIFMIGIFSMLYIRNRIVRPLQHVTASTNILATGDLTQSNLEVQSTDEIGQLSEAFNAMKESLSELVLKAQSNAEQLSASSQQLSASTEEIVATTEDVTRRVTNFSELTQTSATSANESSLAMDETAIGVQRIAESSQNLSANAMNTMDTAKSGKEIIQQAESQMQTIHEGTTVVNELVQKLSKQTEEIGNITKVITGITDQTNLLALNAAIEAARAGEHGKGFAVVADEVRKLAEESNHSANSIVALTEEIQMDTVNVEQAVNRSLSSVKDGVNVIGYAEQAFQEISKAVEQMTEEIQDISATSEQLSASAEEVSASVHEIAKGSTMVARDIETITAAMEEQSATMEQVNGVAIHLSENAQELQEYVQKYKVHKS